MLVLYILFFLIVNLKIAKFKSMTLVEVQPITFSMMVIFLYFLGFINKMFFLDYFVLIGVILGIICIYLERYKEHTSFARIISFEKIIDPPFLVFLLVTIIGMVLISNRGVCTNDDLAFWGTDIKSIYVLQGYAEKNMNCAYQYGDYPPGFQLIAAMAMHLFGRYNEGVQMSSYFLTMMIYSATAISSLPKQKGYTIGGVLILPIMFAFGPDILATRSPDVLMGITYGCALVYIFRKYKEGLTEFAVSIILSVTVIMKSIGIQWVVFAVLFYIGVGIAKKRRIFNKSILCMGMPFVVYLMWYFFCKTNGRFSYATQGVFLLTDERNSALREQYGMQLLRVFMKTLMNGQQPSMIRMGISVAGVVFISLFLFWIFKKRKMISAGESIALMIFTIVSGVVEYAILLYSVENMFLGEALNYIVPEHMLMLIRRYGAPFVIGQIMLTISIWLDYTAKYINQHESSLIKEQYALVGILILGFYVLFTPWNKVYDWFIGYRNVPSQIESPLEEKYPGLKRLIPIIEQVEGRQKLLLICDANSMDMFSTTVAQYYSAPMPLYVLLFEQLTSENLEKEIRRSGATALAFVSEDDEWVSPIQISLINNKHVAINNVYYISGDEENGIILDE